jgi:iron complex outermembrane receptor protein
VNVGVGITDSEVKSFANPIRNGTSATLVSDYTLNLGVEYRTPIGASGMDFHARTDVRVIGDTHFWDTDAFGETVREPVDLVDLRLGVEGDNWALTAWSKNLLDEEYNQEYSPGGFIFKALPRRYGVELTRSF